MPPKPCKQAFREICDIRKLCLLNPIQGISALAEYRLLFVNLFVLKGYTGQQKQSF